MSTILSNSTSASRAIGYCAALAVLIGSIPRAATAGTLFFDGFDYTVGENLSNQVNASSGGTWLRPSAPTGATHTIAAGDVPLAGLSVPADSDTLSIPRPPSGTTVSNRINVPHDAILGKPTRTNAALKTYFFSFTMTMTDWTNFAPPTGNPSDTKNDAAAKSAAHRKGGFFAGLHGGAASTTTAMSATNGFAAPILIRREIDFSQTGTDGTPGTQTGRYELGILKEATTPSTAATLETAFDTSVSFGVSDVVFVVGQYQFVDATNAPVGTGDIARLWISPALGNLSAEATPSVIASTAFNNLGGTLALESFQVRGDTNSPGNLRLDNIRVGTTFADVVSPLVVPEPSATLLVAVGSMVASRWRRARR